MVQVVETVQASTMAELRASRDRATTGDLVELRLDGVQDLDVAGALAGRTKPVVVTCRPMWEGGRFDGSEETRLAVLAAAIRGGAEFVDVEWRADRQALVATDRTRVLISNHDHQGVPADLVDRIAEMRRVGSGLIKVAVTANSLRDCLTLKQAVGSAGAQSVIAMGARGLLTRVWPAWFHSAWTYAGAAASGQMLAGDLVATYRVRSTTASTAIYGIAGSPLGHSASPAIHNATFAREAQDALYVPLETADAGEFLEVAEAIGLRGASITAPLKEALLSRTRPIDEVPSRVGAINTIRRDGTEWRSANFDVEGFLAPLDARAIVLRDRRVTVLGAGGAARAAIWALASRGARVDVSARQPARAQALAREFGVTAGEWPPAAGWDVLVNATPAGTWPNDEAAPIDRADLLARPGSLVYDLIYNPRLTTLAHWAIDAGAQAIGGIEMLEAQARRQMTWWMDGIG